MLTSWTRELASSCVSLPYFFELGNALLANKALGVAIIGWGASSAHRTHEAFRQECRSRLESSILAPLIRMKDGTRYRELHELDGGHHQIRTHLIIKRQRQAMACPFPERETA